MSSPVHQAFSNFIHLEKTSKTPLYIQISQQIVNAIQRGYLVLGSKLPGSRILSTQLGINRQTIVAVYQELEALSWVETRPNRGTFVINQSERDKSSNPYQTHISLAQYPLHTGYAFRKSNILDNPYQISSADYVFNDGSPDFRLTQINNLSKIYSSSLKRKSNRKKIIQQQNQGSEYFKTQLSNYLNYTRSLHISKENLLITRSMEMSLYIITQILIQPDDWVLVAELSYFSANMIFKQAGAKVKTIPIDENGIDVDHIKTHFKPGEIRLIYITPHHHYPTTCHLSAQRRIDLLQLAKEYGCILIEDDYDYDFQYETSSIMPMASADFSGMVIYIGSFGKSLAPTFRTGFVVAPNNLIVEAQKYLGIIDRQGDVIMEQVLGEMIEEGDIHRHLKKSLKIYRERRDFCANCLNTLFNAELKFSKPAGGLAFWVEWIKPIPLSQLAEICLKNNLFIPKTLLYQNKNICAMRIGFGHLNEVEMHKSLSILKESLEQLKLN